MCGVLSCVEKQFGSGRSAVARADEHPLEFQITVVPPHCGMTDRFSVGSVGEKRGEHGRRVDGVRAHTHCFRYAICISRADFGGHLGAKHDRVRMVPVDGGDCDHEP
jgi:hypothetical protein